MSVENKLDSGNYSESLNRVVCSKVPEHSVCLDVGCWDGNMGEYLSKSKSCVVDGIDVNSQVLGRASTRGYRNTFNINLNSESYNLSELPRDYDVFLFADVLEHLINPQNLLLEIKPHLKPNGKVIISLPNVAFFLNRLNLLLGRWDYTEFGTLDKTHLKFYTLKTAKTFVESAGYKVENVTAYNQFKRLELLDPLLNFFPELLGYQILVEARNL